MSVYTKTTDSNDNVLWENLKNPIKISDDNIILICHRNTLNKKLECCQKTKGTKIYKIHAIMNYMIALIDRRMKELC